MVRNIGEVRVFATAAGSVLHDHDDGGYEPALLVWCDLDGEIAEALRDDDAVSRLDADPARDAADGRKVLVRALVGDCSCTFDVPVSCLVGALAGIRSYPSRAVQLVVIPDAPTGAFWQTPVRCDQVAGCMTLPLPAALEALACDISADVARDLRHVDHVAEHASTGVDPNYLLLAALANSKQDLGVFSDVISDLSREIRLGSDAQSLDAQTCLESALTTTLAAVARNIGVAELAGAAEAAVPGSRQLVTLIMVDEPEEFTDPDTDAGLADLELPDGLADLLADNGPLAAEIAVDDVDDVVSRAVHLIDWGLPALFVEYGVTHVFTADEKDLAIALNIEESCAELDAEKVELVRAVIACQQDGTRAGGQWDDLVAALAPIGPRIRAHCGQLVAFLAGDDTTDPYDIAHQALLAGGRPGLAALLNPQLFAPLGDGEAAAWLHVGLLALRERNPVLGDAVHAACRALFCDGLSYPLDALTAEVAGVDQTETHLVEVPAARIEAALVAMLGGFGVGAALACGSSLGSLLRHFTPREAGELAVLVEHVRLAACTQPAGRAVWDIAVASVTAMAADLFPDYPASTIFGPVPVTATDQLHETLGRHSDAAVGTAVLAALREVAGVRSHLTNTAPAEELTAIVSSTFAPLTMAGGYDTTGLR